MEYAAKYLRDNFRPIVFEPLSEQLLDLLRELEETERKSKEPKGRGDD
jgi:hypothetical protein